MLGIASKPSSTQGTEYIGTYQNSITTEKRYLPIITMNKTGIRDIE